MKRQKGNNSDKSVADFMLVMVARNEVSRRQQAENDAEPC